MLFFFMKTIISNMQEEEVLSKFSAENNQKMHINHHESDETELFDFSQLPWVVFLTILKFFKTDELCRLCLVNKHWKKACLDPSLWRNLDLVKYHSISDDDLFRLTSYSNNVVKLKISQCVDACILTDSGLSHVLQQCLSLVECSIVHCRELSDNVLATLGKCCHFLKKLDITLSLNFTDDGMKKVSEGCPELEEIIIDQCAKLTNETLVHLGRHSKMLKYISATSITNITDQGVLALLQGCRKLETLRLPLCGLSGKSTGHIVQHSADNIAYLDLRGVMLEDSHIHNLVMSLTRIETLNLGLCYNLTDVSVMEIAKSFRKIKHLFLVNTKVTDEGLSHLSACGKTLVHLDVSWCQGVTEVGAGKVLSGCPKLEHLGLFRCDKVSESAVIELSLQFPQVFISTLETEMKKSRRINNTHQDSS